MITSLNFRLIDAAPFALAAVLAGCGGASLSGRIRAVGFTAGVTRSICNTRLMDDAAGEKAEFDLRFVGTYQRRLRLLVFGAEAGGNADRFYHAVRPLQRQIRQCLGANDGASQMVEYAHGGTSSIATLGDPSEYPEGCAVDPATGNLAVANFSAIAAAVTW